MDIIAPFPLALSQLKYLLLVIEYFTKWIELDTLEIITSTNILNFLKKNILVRFGVPRAIMTDNETQFIDKKFKFLLE